VPLISKNFSVYLNDERLIGVQAASIDFDPQELVQVRLTLDVEEIELDTEAKAIRLKVATEETFWTGIKEKQDKN
jgi:hypothetical protein